MMSVSNDFKQAVDSMERNIVGKLEIYFDGESSSPITFYRDMIIDFKILEEASADSQNPLGVVSSNELTISLHNKSSVFTISNANSPYYNKIRKNVLIKPYIGVTLENEEIEYIQMGKYYIDDWKSPSNSLETSVTAYDLLYGLGQKDCPELPLMIDIDIKDVFVVLFTALGLTADDYIIDSNILCKLQYVWFDGNVKSMLQKLSAIGNCTVCMNRQSKIYVKSNNTNKAIVTTLKDSTQIITAQNIQNYNSIISKVNLNYNFITLSDATELISIKQYKLKKGINSFSNISFSNTPVVLIKKVSLLGSTAAVENIKYGTNSISFDIVSNKEETTDILVTGIYAIKNSSKVSVSNDELVNEIGEVNLDISSDIIQNSNIAETVAKDILNVVSMKNSQYTVTSRGNPSLELMDNIIIDDESDRIYNTPITILRQQITWDGALNIDIEGRSLVSANAFFNLNRRIGIVNSINTDAIRSTGISTTSNVTEQVDYANIASNGALPDTNNSEIYAQPFNTYYNHNRFQYFINPGEVSELGLITSLYIKCIKKPDIDLKNITIRMKSYNNEITVLNNDNWNVVYGPHDTPLASITEGDWFKFELDTSFNWAEGNLYIDFYRENDSYGNVQDAACDIVLLTAPRTACSFDDTEVYPLDNPGTFEDGSMFTDRQYALNTMLDISSRLIIDTKRAVNASQNINFSIKRQVNITINGIYDTDRKTESISAINHDTNRSID